MFNVMSKMSKQQIKISDYNFKFSLKNKMGRVLWIIFCLILFRPFFSKFFRKWRILLLKIFGAKICWRSEVYSSVKIWAPWNLTLGYDSCLGPQVDCYNQGKITIGDNTVISQKTYLCASSHDYTSNTHTLILRPITIHDQVWIAADAFIGPGVTIGQGSVIGARSAVFKDIDNWSVVGGNPAKFIKKRVIC